MSENDNMSLEDVLRAIADVEGIENPVLEIEVEDEPPSVPEWARIMATKAVDAAEVDSPETVGCFTVVFLKLSGGTYSVVDNGEQVDDLNRAQAIRIVAENLAAEHGRRKSLL